MSNSTDYINSIREIIKDLQFTKNKKLLEYWQKELYIITGEKPTSNSFTLANWWILEV